MIATVVDWDALLEVIWVSLLAGVGVTAAWASRSWARRARSSSAATGRAGGGRRLRRGRRRRGPRWSCGDRLRHRDPHGRLAQPRREPLELLLGVPGAHRRAHPGAAREEADHDALRGGALDERLGSGHLEGDERAWRRAARPPRRARAAARRGAPPPDRRARARARRRPPRARRATRATTRRGGGRGSPWSSRRASGWSAGTSASLGITPARGSRSTARAGSARARGSRRGSRCRPGRRATSGPTRRRSRSRAPRTSTGTAPRPCAPSSRTSAPDAASGAVSMTRPVAQDTCEVTTMRVSGPDLARQLVERYHAHAARRACRAPWRAGRARRGAPRRS